MAKAERATQLSLSLAPAEGTSRKAMYKAYGEEAQLVLGLEVLVETSPKDKKPQHVFKEVGTLDVQWLIIQTMCFQYMQ